MTIPVERLRTICLSLPEVTERLSHGEATWFVRGKRSFVMMWDGHHGSRVAFHCAGPPGAQQALVGDRPESFYVPPYVGHRGWIGVFLDVPVDWSELEAIVTEAYRCVAPAALAAQLDQR